MIKKIIIILITMLIFIVALIIKNSVFIINIPDNILDTIKVMEKQPFVDFIYYGAEDTIYKQQGRSAWLYKNTTNEELKMLLHYPNNNIKVFALFLLYHDELDANIFQNKDVVDILNEEFEIYDGNYFSYKLTIKEFIAMDTVCNRLILRNLYRRK